MNRFWIATAFVFLTLSAFAGDSSGKPSGRLAIVGLDPYRARKHLEENTVVKVQELARKVQEQEASKASPKEKEKVKAELLQQLAETEAIAKEFSDDAGVQTSAARVSLEAGDL